VPVDRDAALRTAERLLRQGKLEGAIAEYVRLTDDQPRDWNSVNALGDLYVRAGNPERAVAQFVRIADHLFDEGFLPKAGALYKKALKVKHDHEHTLFRLSEIAVQQGLLADGKLYLRQLAQQRQNRGDQQGAAECVLRLGSIDEDDGEAKLAAANAAQAIGRTPEAVVFLQEAAAAFEKQRRSAEAVDALVAATQLVPDDQALRATVARTLLAAGQTERAQPFLTASAVADDPDLLLAVARHDLTSGRTAEGHAGLMRAVALAPDRQEQVARLADDLCAANRIHDAYGCIEVLADAALFEAAFDRATQLLESFLARHRVIPALLKLVDVYVDAGLDDRITAVQEQLADAYMDDGQPAQARVVAEDLIARAPDVEVNVQRLRRALIALGVDDIEAVVARQLDVAPIFDELLEFDSMDSEPSPVAPQEPAVPPEAAAPPVERFESFVPVDNGPTVDMGEIDLSALLGNLKTGADANARPPAVESAAAGGAVDPTTLFEQAQEHLRRGAVADAAAALQAAARSPQLRFKAASQLGRLAIAHGDMDAGVEWLEQAASAPSPSPEESCAVIYDLADALDRAGEHVRALAVFMELEADAGSFRDVRARIDRLTSTTGVNGDRA
jgi:tetratricopeptide (TPR) repeat protein